MSAGPDQITIEPHPLLDPAVFVTRFPTPLGERETPASILGLLSLGAEVPFPTGAPEIKTSVRDLLRHGGFKPTGRNKPASEYLKGALEKGRLGPESGINPAVDICNVVSLHSGLPISVVDTGRAAPPWRLAVAKAGAKYVFNPSGQVIDIGGLICLHDADGPCGGPVKDSQRTKTSAETRETLTVIWGTNGLPGRTEQALAWYQELLGQVGAETRTI